jgi:hypothetical protein
MISLSAEMEELARRLAERNGKTPEQVVADAIAAEAHAAGLVTDASEAARKDIDLDRVAEIVRRVSARPLRDRRPARDILAEAWERAG